MSTEDLLRNANDLIINLPVYTKRGNPIPNEQRPPKPPPSMAEAENIVLSHHATARTRSLASGYNCVGMVFAARRTWIETDHVDMILREDGYRRVDFENELQVGDVVVYRTDDGLISHVGLITCIRPDVRSARWDITVLSRWGHDGEYLHRIDDVSPYMGEPREYWTDRP